MSESSHDWLPKVDLDSEAVVEEDYSLAPELVETVRELLAEERIDAVQQLLEPLHVADVADLLEYLTKDELQLVIEGLWSFIDPEVLTYLDAAVREEVIELLGPKQLARAVTEMDSDDALRSSRTWTRRRSTASCRACRGPIARFWRRASPTRRIPPGA